MFNGVFDEVLDIFGLVVVDLAELKVSTLMFDADVAHLSFELAGQAEDETGIGAVTN